MKKPYLRSAILTFGFLASTFIIDGQTGAGGGGGGAAGGAAGGGTAAAGGAATGAAGAGTATGGSATAGSANASGGTAVRGTSQANTGGRANTGAGGVNTFGGASALEANPNTTAGSQGAISTGVAPGSGTGVNANQSQALTLPAGVQNTLGGFAANGSLGSVTAVPGQPGTYRATVTQNGVPMEITIGSNGQILSRTPMTGQGPAGLNPTAANASATLGSAAGAAPGVNSGTTTPFVSGAVMPPTAVVMGDLPNTVQDAIRSQLGEAEANRIMQSRSATGANYVVSYDQNGRPMTLVVGPDGRILSNGPATASSTATASATTDRTTNATREVSMTLDELPSNIEDVLKQTAPYAEVRTVRREQRVGGDVYVIAVREGDRAGDITIDANGKVIRDTRRDLSTLSASGATAARNDDQPVGMPYDTLPVAIQNAVKAYAATSDVRSVTLGLDTDGRTVYDVIFYRDGRRDRMIIRKDGKLVRIEENVSPAMEFASTKPAVLAIGDLPQEVQDTIRRQTDTVQIKEIGTKEVANETVYAVRWDTNGAPVELLVSRDGVIIQPEGSPEAERAAAPTVAPLDREEAATVKIVDDTRGTDEATENIGAAARTERGVSVSTEVSAGDRADTKVNLTDAPAAVQDTAKKLAGAGTIESITPKLDGGGMVYEVRYSDNGESRTVQIDRNGTVKPESTTSTP
jgi:hypothetical protein